MFHLKQIWVENAPAGIMAANAHSGWYQQWVGTAISTRHGKLLRYDDDPHQLHDSILKAAFRQAAQEARRLGEGVDGLLEVGALHLRECAELLGQVTGLDPYDLRGWSPGEVQQANGNFHFPKSRRVAYWSARKFLETCADHHLGVRFSY